MVVDRVERHDIVNAALLACVLLLLGLGILTAASSLASTVDEGVVESTKEVDPPAADGAETTQPGVSAPIVPDETGTDPDDTEPTLPEARPPAEVTVRVGNGARRPGVAGAGTDVLETAGYLALAPKNGPTIDDSVVYFATGYAAEAAGVAELLGLEPTQTEAMPSDPGIPIEGAQVIAILGVNSDF